MSPVICCWSASRSTALTAWMPPNLTSTLSTRNTGKAVHLRRDDGFGFRFANPAAGPHHVEDGRHRARHAVGVAGQGDGGQAGAEVLQLADAGQVGLDDWEHGQRDA